MTVPGYSICAADGLGRSLRLWRALRRVKQAHAAELLRVSQAMVSRWEAGTLVPDAEEQARLRELMSARLDSAGDHALARLVTGSSASAHLVCDLTHRLLAASRGREPGLELPHAGAAGRLALALRHAGDPGRRGRPDR